MPAPKRQRTILACNRCRARKVKVSALFNPTLPIDLGAKMIHQCDGGYPSCFHCQDTDARCEYRTPHREQQEAIPDNTLILEQRLKALEDTVQRLRKTSCSTAEESDESDTPELVIQDLPDDFTQVQYLCSSSAQDGIGSTGEEFYGPSSNIFYLRQILGEVDSTTLSSFRGTDSKISEFIKPECSPPAAVFHMESVPVAKHTDNEGLYVLPPDHTTRSLVELFFRDYGSMNPFLDKATFFHTHVDPIYESTLPPDASKLALLDMVLAIATASSIDSITPTTRRFFISRLFFERSKSLLSKDDLACGNLEQVQSYLLMSQYLQSTDRCSDSWSTYSMAVQKALRQGLHNVDYLAKDFAPEREAKRRTWQLCLFLDSAVSMHFGRPSLLGPYVQRADYFVNQPLPALAPRPSPLDKWPEEKSSTFFYLSFKLYAILGQIVNTEYFQSPKPLDLSRFMDIIASIACMSQKLDEWLDSLPEEWRAAIIDSSAAPVDEANSQNNLYRVLALVLVLSAVGKLANSNDITPTSRRQILMFSRPSLETSIDSAEAIVATINAFEGGKPGPGMWWTLIHIVYNAALTCFALICLQTRDTAFGGSQAAFKARVYVDLARQAFCKLVPDHPAVERASSFLRHIARLCDHIVQQNVSTVLIDSVLNIPLSQADTEYLGPESFPFDFSMFEHLDDPLFTNHQSTSEGDTDVGIAIN
ncbi:C6 transcription factor [Fusarium globosum]|uniref:C6 transcription factor n=1 Tax=Fusarium globosum TaxID=78864 RepID=A0A8H5XJ07_9HYPO|nr:C6 transcription factor [Fusarium globosum]